MYKFEHKHDGVHFAYSDFIRRTKKEAQKTLSEIIKSSKRCYVKPLARTRDSYSFLSSGVVHTLEIIKIQ